MTNREIDKRVVVVMFETMQQQQQQIGDLIKKSDEIQSRVQERIEESMTSFAENYGKIHNSALERYASDFKNQTQNLIKSFNLTKIAVILLILPTIMFVTCWLLLFCFWIFTPSLDEIKALRKEKAIEIAQIEQLRREKTAIEKISLRSENNKIYVKISKKDCLPQSTFDNFTTTDKYCKLTY